jgi:hypothetical protein
MKGAQLRSKPATGETRDRTSDVFLPGGPGSLKAQWRTLTQHPALRVVSPKGDMGAIFLAFAAQFGFAGFADVPPDCAREGL